MNGLKSSGRYPASGSPCRSRPCWPFSTPRLWPNLQRGHSLGASSRRAGGEYMRLTGIAPEHLVANKPPNETLTALSSYIFERRPRPLCPLADLSGICARRREDAPPGQEREKMEKGRMGIPSHLPFSHSLCTLRCQLATLQKFF